MKQPEIYRIKDGLHELGVMGKRKGNQRLILLQRFLGVYERMIKTNIQRTLRNFT